MSTMTRTAVAALALFACTSTGLQAQRTAQADRAAYLRAVASFFRMPQNEVSILADWDLPLDQIPVALFIAGRAGVSPDAVVALHRTGHSWTDLATRYSVSAAALHVPIPETASAGPLQQVYARYRSLPAKQWSQIRLSNQDIVTLVNVRLLAQTLKIPPQQVLAAAAPGTSFVDVYANLIRSSG